MLLDNIYADSKSNIHIPVPLPEWKMPHM